ncbi:MAG: sensor histidine kinase, partial [Cyanophyceae cyanobacterium]
PDQIIQVLTNLLSNAIKYSPSQGTITIVSQLRDQQLWISVIDQGPGIPAEQLEIIFEPFRQVDASDSRKKGGTGLGLAICRQIVTQHQGRIWAESGQGQGCTIWITLPIYTQDN